VICGLLPLQSGTAAVNENAPSPAATVVATGDGGGVAGDTGAGIGIGVGTPQIIGAAADIEFESLEPAAFFARTK
jgi:hypothetical protein